MIVLKIKGKSQVEKFTQRIFNELNFISDLNKLWILFVFWHIKWFQALLDKKCIYFWVKHSCLNKIFYCEFYSFFLYDVNSKIKPLEMSFSVSIRSHVNLVMILFNFRYYLQVAHREASIECYIWLWLCYFFIKTIENNILSLLPDNFFVSKFSYGMIDERAVLYIFNGLNLQLYGLKLFAEVIATILFGYWVRYDLIIDRDLLFSLYEALLFFIFIDFIY